MLNVYLFEPDEVHQKIIREIHVKYSITHNLELSFKVTSEIPESISCIDGYSSETSLYMIEGHKSIKNLSASISEINPENYIVLIAGELNDIAACISADFRPSGVLIKPVEYTAAEKIFDDIYADYMKRSTLGKGNFRFRIRSREYSIAVNSIMYFEAANKKMILRTSGQAFEFYMSADEVMKKLPNNFVRIHKSYIVNVDHVVISDFKNMIAELDDGSKIFISRTYKSNLQTAISERSS